MGASAPFWRFSAASYPDLNEMPTVDGLVGAGDRALLSDTDTVEVCASLRFAFKIPS